MVVRCDFFPPMWFSVQTFNTSLQGRKKLISDVAQSVFSFHSKLRLFRKDLETKTFAHFKCLKKIVESHAHVQVETEDYLSKISGLAEEINDRFNDLKTLKPSLSFLENPFTVDVVGNGCPVSSPITKDTAAVELEILELQEHEGLRVFKSRGVSVIEFWKKVTK